MPAPDAPEGGNNPMPSQGQDQAPLVGGDPGKSKKMMWLWIIIIAVLLAALLLGWLWWKDKDKKDAASTSTSTTEQQTVVEEVTCEAEFTAYENAELGLGFCYPTDWGTVTVTDARLQKTPTEVEGTVIAADTGQRWRVSFSEKPAVNLGVVTADWSTEIGRGGSCVDPATTTLPAFSPFSTEWEVETTFASRGIEVMANEYLINESADEYHNGVCILGYTIINAEDYTHSTASYYKEFGGTITTPEQHVDNPTVLAPEADRNDFYTFVKSVHAL